MGSTPQQAGAVQGKTVITPSSRLNCTLATYTVKKPGPLGQCISAALGNLTEIRSVYTLADLGVV